MKLQLIVVSNNIYNYSEREEDKPDKAEPSGLNNEDEACGLSAPNRSNGTCVSSGPGLCPASVVID